MKIVADVYSYKITEEDYKYSQALFTACDSTKKSIKNRALDYLIDRCLLLNEARKFDVEVSEDEWNEKLFEIAQNFENEEEFINYLDNKQISRTRYEYFLKESLYIIKFLDKFRAFIKERVANDVNRYVTKYSDIFTCCPKAHVYNILLQGITDDNFKKLMNVRKNINNLEDFRKVASEISECPAGVTCGDMGLVSADLLIEELDQAIFSLPLNEVSLPIKSKFGYHLILVTERQDSKQIQDKETKDFMLNCFIDNKSELYLHSYVDELRKDAQAQNKIKIHFEG